MKTLPVDSGPKAEIVAIIEDSGKCPVENLLENLSKADRTKLFQLFKLFCLMGEIRNIQKFRFEEDSIWCFKSFQIRVLCFFKPTAKKRCLVLTHGFIKKQDKMPKTELDRAKRYYQQFMAR